jgi:hypothetical protein
VLAAVDAVGAAASEVLVVPGVAQAASAREHAATAARTFRTVIERLQMQRAAPMVESPCP